MHRNGLPGQAGVRPAGEEQVDAIREEGGGAVLIINIMEKWRKSMSWRHPDGNILIILLLFGAFSIRAE